MDLKVTEDDLTFEVMCSALALAEERSRTIFSALPTIDSTTPATCDGADSDRPLISCGIAFHLPADVYTSRGTRATLLSIPSFPSSTCGSSIGGGVISTSSGALLRPRPAPRSLLAWPLIPTSHYRGAPPRHFHDHPTPGNLAAYIPLTRLLYFRLVLRSPFVSTSLVQSCI